ncbi:MAG: GFA family protein [Myxococcota bacterium]
MTKGSCLCGEVQFEIGDNTTDIGMCHCSKCRKVSGTASNATLMVSSDGLRWISGEDSLLKYANADGWGAWRCAVCGSPTPRLHGGGGAYWVPVGLLDGDPGVEVAGHIFVGSKAAWDELHGKKPQYEAGFESKKLK